MTVPCARGGATHRAAVDVLIDDVTAHAARQRFARLQIPLRLVYGLDAEMGGRRRRASGGQRPCRGPAGTWPFERRADERAYAATTVEIRNGVASSLRRRSGRSKRARTSVGVQRKSEEPPRNDDFRDAAAHPDLHVSEHSAGRPVATFVTATSQ